MTTAPGFSEQTFDAGEVQLNFAEFDGSGPPLLFVHGITSDWTVWKEIAAEFVDDWHCYAIDLRGHGRSGHLKNTYNRAKYSEDVVAFVRDHIREPTYIVGHSLGGATALGVAAAIPDSIQAAVYEDPALFVHLRAEETAKARFGERLDMMKSGLATAEIAARMRSPGESEQDAITRTERWMRCDPNTLEMSINRSSTKGWDVDSILKAATPRSLLLQANPDAGGALSDDEADRAISLLPNAVHIKWDDSGHNMHHSSRNGSCL
ncbi:MAG: alpha/beta hydrolase [Chloroflexi bacterium]|nr:alpha/beta hydrolase [Chloroflexota bacterium]